MTDHALRHQGKTPGATPQAPIPSMEGLMGADRLPKDVISSLGRRLGLIGHPDRLHVLLLLHRHGELCVCQIMERIRLSQPRISQLLRPLREGRLVVGRREGQRMLYSLSPDALLAELMGCMERLRVKGMDKKSPA